MALSAEECVPVCAHGEHEVVDDSSRSVYQRSRAQHKRVVRVINSIRRGIEAAKQDEVANKVAESAMLLHISDV